MAPPPIDRLGASEPDLVTANESFDSSVLPERTRFRRLKAFLLRILSLTTRRQVSFNAAVVRILNGWNERLPRLGNEIAERFRAADERAQAAEDRARTAIEKTNQRMAAAEGRGAARELQLSGSLLALEERLRDLEARVIPPQVRTGTHATAADEPAAGRPEAAGQPRPVCLLVLGMHRSGTSALAGCLHWLGVPLGEPLLQPDAANERGYWEHGEIVAVHDELLASFGAAALDLSLLPPSWPFGPEAEKAREKLRILILGNFSGRPLWAVKDPRLPVLLPLWLDLLRELGTEPRFAVMLRDPWEVAMSLKARHGLGAWESLELWLRHTVEAERLTRGYRRTGISYDELLTGPVPAMKRIGQDLDVVWPRSLADAGKEIAGFLEPALRHWRRPSPPANAPAELVSALASVSERTLATLRGGDRTALARLFGEISKCESLLQRASGPAEESLSPTGRVLSGDPDRGSMSRRRILIILNNYPQLSQTYVKTEIGALREEYEIHVAALGVPNVADPIHHPFRVTPDRASLMEMIRELKPDVLHAQHLVFIQLLASISRETGTPFTVRAHSFDALLPGKGEELPGHLNGIDRVLNQDLCLGVLTLPFTRTGLESLGVWPDKIVDCPPVVDVARFLDRNPNTGGVMNVGAGIPKKKMEDFLAAGQAVPGIPFDLYVVGHGRDRLEEINRAMGSPVNVQPPVPFEEMPGVYKRHRWLLYTACRQMKTVGWPMAVAEAQASGTMVLMPNLRPDLAEYVGEGGFLYDTLEEAIDLLRQPVPAWKRELGFEHVARWDACRHIHLLTDRWESALR